MSTTNGRVPQAREEKLLIHELPDETLVYDLNRHRAHGLNRTAAFIWRHCDGKTTAAEMAALAQRELNVPADEDVVWAVLRRLGKAHLLQERITPPDDAMGCSRREVMRKLAMVGGLALVTSIVAPEAAQAATCVSFSGCPSGKHCCFSGCSGCTSTRCGSGCGGTCCTSG
jgi:Coenzyme PQQ synthesis protein D (PqqD)